MKEIILQSGVKPDENDEKSNKMKMYWMLFHHERLNGEKTPFGKKADEIPTILRIATIADAFHGKAKEHSADAILEQMYGEKHKGEFDLSLLKIAEPILRARASLIKPIAAYLPVQPGLANPAIS